MSIQRYSIESFAMRDRPDDDVMVADDTGGEYVTLADHLAEVEAAIEQEDRIIPIIRRNEREDGMLNEQQRIVTLIEAMCIAGEHYNASHVYYESEYVLCGNCKYIIDAIKGDSA